jgi:CheY-like chemotaxis protein
MLSRIEEYEDLERVSAHFGRAKPCLQLGIGRRGLASPVALMQMSSPKGQVIEPESHAGRGRPRRKRILLVDDEESVRQTISIVLRLDDHTVIEAENGRTALELFLRDHFDLVITDFEMPIMRGNELAVRIKQHSPAQPVLMITAYAERLREFDNPVDGILDKPFHIEDLRQRMAELLS